ncbi:hypothetical protein EAG_05011 [Camponotus floridanus]|uniref:BACK domain-containing protein n=1 Tax=Camponotus floridanus TaxID=104421 RepID=E2A1A7_CAMFO|nr:hypothetical protein EAG_05011 [Camponotus floridanus]
MTLILQDFIKWINSDKHNTIKLNFERNDLGRLLTLLELSVLFAVDNLIESITEILEKYHLLPQDVLNIWLLAQELGVKTLQDLCLAVCLDRFTELPRNLIFKLSRQNFLRLVGNSNLRVPDESELYLNPVVTEWMQINRDTIPLDILKKTGPKVYSSIICYGSNSSVNNECYIHCWDGDKLFELTTFKYPEAIINNNTITGMQITPRGHHLYLSGGEFGIGTGRFNTHVWRYSLITKRWFLETIMPCARRHMIAAFLQNKLLLAGGVGHFRCKLRSLDIYNVHKGTWVKGAVLPMEFVSIPAYYAFDKKLIIYIHNIKAGVLPFVHIYFCDSDEWYTMPLIIDYDLRLDMCELFETMPIKFKTALCYIGKY